MTPPSFELRQSKDHRLMKPLYFMKEEEEKEEEVLEKHQSPRAYAF
jgi:hypothetical protein